MSRINKFTLGLGWGSLSTIVMASFQLVFMAIMARLLEPAQFGLVAVANVSLRFFSYFAQMGISPALIQKPTLEDGDVRAALALSLTISIAFLLLAVASAPAIESFFDMPELSAVTQVLALNFIISGFSAVSLGLMRRNAKFRALAIVEIASYVGGYGLIGLLAAYAGAGVWALVAAFVSQNILTAVISYVIVRHPLGLTHTSDQRRHFLTYGGRYSIIGFIEFLTSNIDALLVGKILGATPAGYYSRAVLLANLPVQQPASVLTKVLFPIMSSVGNRADKQAIGFQLSVVAVGSYAFAAGAGIFAAAADIVIVLLGVNWLEAIPILKVLAWSVGPLYLSHVAGVTLDSLNELSTKFLIQISTLVLLLGLLAVFVPFGSATAIATAVVIVEWVRMLIMGVVLVRLLRISAKDVAIIACCVGVVAVCSGLAVVLASRTMQVEAGFVRLCMEILAGAAGLFAGFLIARRFATLLPAIRFLADRVPRFAKLLPRRA